MHTEAGDDAVEAEGEHAEVRQRGHGEGGRGDGDAVVVDGAEHTEEPRHGSGVAAPGVAVAFEQVGLLVHRDGAQRGGERDREAATAPVATLD